MDKNELQKLIAESLSELTREDVSAVDQEMDTDEFEVSNDLPMSVIDMPIQDKGAFSAMGGNEPYDDEFSDLDGYKEFGNDYEGNYQDDASISPGYFNEDEEVPMSAVDMPIQDKAIFNAMDTEETEEDMSDIARYRKNKGGDYEGGFQDDVSISPGYFDESEIAEMIREGVEKLHRKSLIENRLEQINNELNMINNPEAWEDARIEAKSQLAKKSIAWNNISKKDDLLSEMSFRDIEIPVIALKDTATIEANSKWDNMQKESVSEIMRRAADLMAEAKKKYNDISK